MPVKKSVKGRVKKSVRRIAVPNKVMVPHNEVMVQDNKKVKVEKQSRFNIFKKFLSKHKGKIFLAITLLITLGVGKKYEGDIKAIINKVQIDTGLPKKIIEFLRKLVQKNPNLDPKQLAEQVVAKPAEVASAAQEAAFGKRRRKVRKVSITTLQKDLKKLKRM